MQDEEQKERGFTVVDRREQEQEEGAERAPEQGAAAQPGAAPGGAASADDAAASARSEADAAPGASTEAAATSATSAADAPASAAAGATSSAAHEAEAPPLPPADFSSLAFALANSALYHLGLAPGPGGGAPGEKNLPVARHTIDTLEMLQQKTAGNLDEEEQKLLAHLLTELRMQFVEAKRN